MNKQNNDKTELEGSVTTKQKTKVGIFGGSFDPPTIAHMQIACEIYNNFDYIDEVWMMPCGDNRFNKNVKTPSNHRLKMLNLIKEDLIPFNFPLKIDTTELENGKYLPTYHLLKELTVKHPDKEFIICVGTDLVSSLKSWIEGEKLINEYRFILISRENYLLSDLTDVTFPKNYEVLKKIISGSSTQIRNRIQNPIEEKLHLAINGLTTPIVIKYIEDNKLYLIDNQ